MSLQVDSVLRPLLSESLDINTFCICVALPDQSILDSALLVDQTAPTPSGSLTSQLLSGSAARSVAIVDRSADIELAARAIATARFGFGGNSPYAPDLVLVNEFVKEPFFEACSRYATLLFARAAAAKKIGPIHSATRRAIVEAEEKGQVSSFGSSDFKLVDILDR